MHRTLARPAPLHFPLPSTHSSNYGIDRCGDIAYKHSLPQLTPGYLEPTVRNGLRTPPADEMGTTYQHPSYSNYGGVKHEAYPVVKHEGTYNTPSSTGTYTPSTIGAYTPPAVSSNAYSGAYSGANGPTKSYPALGQPTPCSTSSLRNEVLASHPSHYLPTSPHIVKSMPVEDLAPARRKSVSSEASAIQPNLQIPSSINNSGGSLAEFAAQITCLFWFEPTETLKTAENLSSAYSPVKRLRPEAIPTTGFKKWVVTILSTTQVTQNVILLALLFIYRLKTINPAVKGRSGSEYRLLTVALMLGNKFLDDNTYTNKTWAEVSGISVQEIHVMEVEFLSNMRYSLLASKEQWQEWQKKLGKFWTYCDEATRVPVPQPISAPKYHTSLVSPPSSVQTSPPSGGNLHLSNPYSSNWPNTSYAAPQHSPLPTMPDLDMRSRKRSYQEEADENPPAKRIIRQTLASAPGTMPFTSKMPPIRQDAPRLPVPNLTISTSQSYNGNFNGTNGYSQHGPLLPPLSGLAVSSSFPTTPTWAPQLPMLTPTGSNQNGTHGVNGNGYNTPSRRTSPHSVHELLSLGSSPISANFPNFNSPSFYLQQRASPYKPVRHVNTLLYPPPSASMHDYSSLNADQMHYQPLGKRNDYRTGVAYPPYQQHQQQWTLPQPNFHA